jgi:hypothetical protein
MTLLAMGQTSLNVDISDACDGSVLSISYGNWREIIVKLQEIVQLWQEIMRIAIF